MAKFIDLYLPLIDAVQTELGCGYVEASEIVDANEAYLTDMIEFNSITNVEFLADIITTNDN